MRRIGILFATSFAVCCLTSGVAGEADPRWYACEVSDDCEWLIGEGGWPVAVRASSTQDYREWAQSQAPFTTYLMPADCFDSDEQFETYLQQSKTRVACVEQRCLLDMEPKCTK